MIKAVIFDVDGTMVDSEPLHVLAWDRALQEVGYRLIDLSETLQQNMAGKKPAVIAGEMVEDLGLQISSDELLQKKTEIFMKLIKTNLRGMPGVVASVKRLKEEGFKLGIGTSLNKEYIDIVLSNWDVLSYFDVIVTGDEIKNGKPDPETYLKVAERLGVKPEECVVIEDAASGIKSAKAAGCYCIAIENLNALKQDLSQADEIINSHDEVTIDFLKTLS